MANQGRVGDRYSLVAEWRNALRDSGLDRTSKLIGFVLATYFTRDGKTGHDLAHPSPAKTTLARGASLSTAYKGSRAVDAAVDHLVEAGLLEVERRRGWQGFRYQALIPHAHAGLSDGQSRTNGKFNPARNGSSIPHRGAGESAERAESGAQTRGVATHAPLRLVDECLGCDELRPLDIKTTLCDDCAAKAPAA
jgi:hypothetical protein